MMLENRLNQSRRGASGSIQRVAKPEILFLATLFLVTIEISKSESSTLIVGAIGRRRDLAEAVSRLDPSLDVVFVVSRRSQLLCRHLQYPPAYPQRLEDVPLQPQQVRQRSFALRDVVARQAKELDFGELEDAIESLVQDSSRHL